MGEAEHRVAEVVEADLGFHALGLGCFGHLARICCERREGLFAINVLACCGRRQRHLLMQRVWRRDRNKVNLGIGHKGAPVACTLLKAERLRRTRCDSSVSVGDGVKNEIKGKFENPWSAGKAEDMGFAHEASANQPNV